VTRQAVTRRRFLAGAAAIAAPWVIPASVLGKDAAVAPSQRITLGVIGLGNRNRSNLGHFLAQSDVQCLAVCDCFADRRRTGKEMVDRQYGNQNCAATRFHEEIFSRPDIDAVLIGTGDRWHAVLSMLAARAGKDIYCEKPFCLTIGEGRALVETTRRYGTVWQCGTQRRSNRSYRFVVDVIRRGMIGKLRTITALLGDWRGAGVARPEPAPDPNVFDYDRWLGQAPWAPYSPLRVAFWRNHWDLSGGVIADMGAHYFDFAQWAHDSELSGPTEYEGTGVWPPDEGFANVPFSVDVQARYPDGVRLLTKGGEKGVRFEGDEGWIHLSDGGDITVEPKSILRERSAPKVDWAIMGDHVRNFLDCIKSRKIPASHPELAHRTHTMIHCANIALRLGRKVQWDPQTEQFVGDDDANRMLQRTMRWPWRV
jgi:predicted dehydrogenase